MRPKPTARGHFDHRALHLALALLLSFAAAACSGGGGDSADLMTADADVPQERDGGADAPDALEVSESSDATEPPPDGFGDVGPGDEALADALEDEAAEEVAEAQTEALEEAGDTSPDEVALDLPPDIDPSLDSDEDGISDVEEFELGTDPLNPDTDFDGIADGQELAEATDPTDPSSASAWHPEWSGHPRLYFDASELPALRARATDPVGPHALILQRLQGKANKTVPGHLDDVFDMAIPHQRGDIAEAAAFLGLLLEDAAMVDKALDILTTETPSVFGLGMEDNLGLHLSEGLVHACAAYDYLAAVPDIDAGRLAAARSWIEARVDDFRILAYEGDLQLIYMLSMNNHGMKALSAFGVCGLVLNDRPSAALDVNEAMTGLDHFLNHYQGGPEGGYAEGFYYQHYAAVSFLPFLAGYHRFAQGESYPYASTKGLTPKDPTNGQVIEVEDFATNEFTRDLFARSRWAAMPNGLLPPLDDGNHGYIEGAPLAWLYDDPRYLWLWEKPSQQWHTQRTEVLSFVAYGGEASLAPDDPALGELAEEPEASLAEAGYALFRDGYDEEDHYLMLIGEHGGVRLHGAGHEHVDNSSFLLWAHGEYLIMDPGYIKWEHHNLVRYAEDHNLILVDGAGAPIIIENIADKDAWLEDWSVGEIASSVRVRVSYEGVDVTRRVTRLQGAATDEGRVFFVVSDSLQPQSEGASHSYRWLLNGNGGGDVEDASFELLPDGARWTRELAGVRAVVVPTEGEGAAVDHDLQEHVTTWGHYAMHERLSVEAAMGERAGFLSLLLPTPAGAEEPAVETWRPEEGVAAARFESGEGTEIVAFLNRRGEVVEASVGPGGSGGAEVMVPEGLSIWMVDGEGQVEVVFEAEDGS